MSDQSKNPHFGSSQLLNNFAVTFLSVFQFLMHFPFSSPYIHLVPNLIWEFMVVPALVRAGLSITLVFS